MDRLEEKWAFENRISDTAEAERRKTPAERAAESAAFRKQNEERRVREVDEYTACMRKALEDRSTFIQHPARTVCKKVGEAQDCTHYPAYTSEVPGKKKAGKAANTP